MIKIAKFGGSSLADAGQFEKVKASSPIQSVGGLLHSGATWNVE